ncbi:MAG: radical SAM protein [Armatimonadota bacterium]
MTNNIFTLKEIKIEVTHRCKLACIHCSSDANPDCNREMQLDQCLSIITDSRELGAQKIALSGGEPLIWDHIAEAVCLSSSLGMEVTIYTSGFVPDVADMFKHLQRLGLHKVAFSLFGSDAPQHELITRVSGSFHATTNAAAIATDLGLETEFHFVPLSSNYRSLRNIAEFAKQLGVGKTSVLRFVPQGRGQLLSSGSLSRIQNIELKRMIEALRRDGYQIRTGSPYNFLMLNDLPICNSGVDRLVVSPDLRIYPCDAFKQVRSEEIVNTSKLSVLDQASLKECWENSPYLMAVRSTIAYGPGGACLLCGNLSRCGSGCLAQKFIASGTLDPITDPMCIHLQQETLIDE